MAAFVHLHNHSEYSLLDAIAKCEDIAARCRELGFDAYALTDHGVMYGAMEFYLAMRQAGLKPIIGCEMYIAPRRLTDKEHELDRSMHHIVLLAQNEEGYVNLMRLCSLAATKGFYYRPRVDTAAIMEHNAGLIALTACPKGIVAAPFHDGGEQAANAALERYLRIFGPERLFLEIQNHGIDLEANFRPWAQDAAARFGVRLVATNDCHYVHAQDARPHDIALCLRDKKRLSDTDRLRYSGEEYYIKSAAQMAELFADCPDALEHTRAAADLCDLELKLDEVHFPRFAIAGDEAARLRQWVSANPDDAAPAEPDNGEPATAEEILAECESAVAAGELASNTETGAAFAAYLRQLTYQGAARRYGAVTAELKERIAYELSVIISKGFTTYFLICAEFCRFARDQGIPVGPGRGSAAGSVVAYCLEITDLDPIKYGLYFERFLNPERVELPDFDIDFCYRRRDEVIEHVRQTYGGERTAQIITYSRLKARAAIKAVGRAKALEFQYVDRVTKEIHGLNPTIADALATSVKLQEMVAADPEIKELVADAERLEGIAAHHSVHAAGVVIAPDELWRYVPVQAQKDSDWLVTQYAMDAVPKTGLVKFDFLGLRNLTMIQDTVDYIAEHEGVTLDPRAIPDDDRATFAMLQRGDAYGVFQFEAPQVKRMLLEGRPASVADLAAINAANRPGPLQSGNTERYLQSRRNGRTDVATYPSIAGILAPTGGVLLFQEQVLEIARELGGFTFGQADVLRKAMGKKMHDVMEAQRLRFMAGAQERGVPEREAEEIWAMMDKFAGYGFNKAHSVCYAWIAYQTAYLKCHYPHYFICAMLNSFMGHAVKLAQILAQCRKMGIEVLPPSVNEGAFEFTPAKGGKIIFGLGGIKRIGAGAVEAIVAERKQRGPFQSTAGFLRRTRGKGVNKKVLQSLAMAGAFDCLDAERMELVKNIDEIERYLRGQDSQPVLFDDFDASGAGGVLPTREVTALDVAMLEKAAVGVFLSHHPFENHAMYADKRFTQLAALQESVAHAPQLWHDRALPQEGLTGLLTDVSVRMSRSNKLYARARLEDPERSARLIIWPQALEQAQEIVEENSPVVVWGRVQFPDAVEEGEDVWESLEVIVDKIERYTPPENTASAGNGEERAGVATDFAGGETDAFAPLPVTIEVDLAEATRHQLELFARALERTKGECEVQMLLREVSGDIRRVKLDQRFAIDLGATAEFERQFPFITFMDMDAPPGEARAGG